jgi:hypothetical protein
MDDEIKNGPELAKIPSQLEKTTSSQNDVHSRYRRFPDMYKSYPKICPPKNIFHPKTFWGIHDTSSHLNTISVKHVDILSSPQNFWGIQDTRSHLNTGFEVIEFIVALTSQGRSDIEKP